MHFKSLLGGSDFTTSIWSASLTRGLVVIPDSQSFGPAGQRVGQYQQAAREAHSPSQRARAQQTADLPVVPRALKIQPEAFPFLCQGDSAPARNQSTLLAARPPRRRRSALAALMPAELQASPTRRVPTRERDG